VRHIDVSPGRKWDIADTFWNVYWKSWNEYKNNLFSKNTNMATKKSKYTDIKNNVLKEV